MLIATSMFLLCTGMLQFYSLHLRREQRRADLLCVLTDAGVILLFCVAFKLPSWCLVAPATALLAFLWKRERTSSATVVSGAQGVLFGIAGLFVFCYPGSSAISFLLAFVGLGFVLAYVAFRHARITPAERS